MAKQLKRGLGALLANIEDVRDEVKADDKVYKVAVEMVQPNPDQPRKSFNQESLIELSQSIRSNGIIQPIVVRKDGDKYVIIAGERRYRAALLAELTEVPVIIKNYDDLKVKEISLIENLQREDLNAIEEAEAIKELMTAHGLTQDEIAQKLGKSRPALANTLRLLNLTGEVKELVKSGKLSAGHARALLPVADPFVQIRMATTCVSEGWSVREVEKQVKYYLKPETKPVRLSDKVREKMTVEMREFVNDMTRVFSTRVKLMGNETKGRICIDYFSNDDLQRIYEIIESLKK
ncbi:MAG: ParB/RepB/Spo0J family partition protein [Clostridia bacterium]|nr:ParB/RepB/Spo0J family partition protein [Clostridia bacterium]